jgi:hypothetical protein
MAEVQIVFSCDETYFLLAKGLVRSIQALGPMPAGFELAFIDLGCTPEHLQWLREQGVRVVPLDTQMLGPLAQFAPGHLRALVLRPFLPLIFSDARAFIWFDSDLWIQGADVLHLFGSMALAHPGKLFICPEWHYSYVDFNANFMTLQVDNFARYYNALYGDSVAKAMAGRPLLNAGIFSLAAGNPLWDWWKHEINAHYSRHYGADDSRVRHMAEQTALNVLAARNDLAVPVDPLFNYMCVYAFPFRDPAGVVRVPQPPNAPISVVHLSLWTQRRRHYWDRALLFDSGRYLTDEEKIAILK